VAFIGPTGSGKSTLVDVLLGLLTPTAGAVRVDGRDIRTDLAAWQRQLGYVPQDIYLVDDTIRRNVAFGLPDAEIDEAAVTRAVRAARLEAFVRTLPDGLQTEVGNRGIRLSGGQRQRLGIARALYHDPSVLVMDEATSGLDGESERETMAAIGGLRGDRTLVLVSHRLATVSACDRVYLIEAGTLKDEGTLRELAERHPHLRVATATTPASVAGR
jgi:ABC-type multidrug transport system fused ATPase/permease subunit